MFKSFLTPLRARFDISPRPEVSKFPPAVETPEEMTPEDFARDVLVELTRTSVESLKVAEDVKSRTAVSHFTPLLTQGEYDRTNTPCIHRSYLSCKESYYKTRVRRTSLGSWMDS